MKYRYVEFQKSEKLRRRQSLADWLFDIVSTCAIAMLVIGLLVCFIGKSARVDGHSMDPTLHDGDRLIITNIIPKYDRGDIVVVGRGMDEPLIKRVIAVEGDTIDINFDTGEVTVNGTVLQEDYIKEPTYLHFDNGPQFPLVVPTGCVFVMGDNRNESLDSRNPSVGPVNTQTIIGKMVKDFGHYVG